jgi:hypothetical protein
MVEPMRVDQHMPFNGVYRSSGLINAEPMRVGVDHDQQKCLDRIDHEIFRRGGGGVKTPERRAFGAHVCGRASTLVTS